MWEPFGSVPANATASWRAGPTERGTLNILSTCLLTLVLCVWTVLHLNIPEHGKAARQVARKTGWLAFGLLAPELVTMVALKQWYDSKKLTRRMSNLLPTDDDVGSSKSRSSPSDVESQQQSSSVNVTANSLEEQENTDEKSRQKRYNTWTFTHSQYALMGGFAFDTSVSSRSFLPHNRTRVTITPLGLEKLAESYPDIIPDISEATINDKSKANALAKLLVCAQASWFAANVIGRLASRQAISLLELNTFVHAICCLATYAAWWSKPFDVDEPTLILVESDHVAQLCAWMFMVSSIGAFRECRLDENVGNISAWWKPSKTHGCLIHTTMSKDETKGFTTNQLISAAEDGERLRYLRYNQQYLDFKLDAPERPWWSKTPKPTDFYLPLSESDLNCIELATRFHDGTKKRPAQQISATYDRYGSPLQEYVVSRVYNLPRAIPLSENEPLWFQWLTKTITLLNSLLNPVLTTYKPDHSMTTISHGQTVYWLSPVVAGSLYGGVHLLAWNGPFTTLRVAMLWKSSSFVIVAPTAILLLWSLLALLWLMCVRIVGWTSKRVHFTMYDVDMSRSSIIIILRAFMITLYLTLLLLINIYALLYIAARLFLVVESFISLAYLPPEVFKVASWSQYIPHFGAG